MLSHAKLNMAVRLADFQREVCSIDNGWIAHFNSVYYKGAWDVLSLRSPGGKTSQIIPDQMQSEEFADTELMKVCSSIHSWLQQFGCPLHAVRLLRLRKDAIIKEHRDHELCFENGEARLHVPIFTNPGVEFYINKQRIIMNEGECWYVNANLPHSVSNVGDADRIHLVLDCVVNDWLKQVFEKSECHWFDPDTSEQKKKIIHELRLQNTSVSNNLADQLEKELSENF